MTIGSYASDYNQGQILKGLVEGEIPINLASATLAPGALGAGSVERSLAGKAADIASALDYIPSSLHSAIKLGTSTADVVSYIEAGLAQASLYVPPGRYCLTRPIGMVSNRRLFGAGRTSILYNDRSGDSVSKYACILLGDSHGAGFSGYAAYGCNAIAAAGATAATVTNGVTTGLAAGDHVYVASATNSAGVPIYGVLTRIVAVAAGVVTFADALDFAIADPSIYKLAGTDADLDVDYHVVSDVQVESLAFYGRSPFASKSAVYGLIARNLWLEDCHIGIGLNSVTHGLIENIYGQFAGRMLEMALNSYDVICRNFKLGHVAVRGTAGEDTQGVPIVVGEQSSRIVLDQVDCSVGAIYTNNGEVATIKGLGVEMLNCRMTHGGTSGNDVVVFPTISATNAPYPAQNINVRGGRYELAVAKARVMNIGGGATGAPIGVRFHNGVELRGPNTSRSIWFQNGSGHEILGLNDYCDKGIVVSSTCRYPALSGYRRR